MRMIRAELFKMRHSTMGKLIWLVPAAAVVLGYLISMAGPYAQQFTYNIWYGTFYPCLIPLLCAMNMRCEIRLHYQALLTSPEFGAGQWAAKCIAAALRLLLAQVIFWGGCQPAWNDFCNRGSCCSGRSGRVVSVGGQFVADSFLFHAVL